MSSRPSLTAPSHLKKNYGPDWETLVPRYIHVLGSDENTTAAFISERIGTTVEDRRSTGQSRQMGGGSQSVNISPHTVRWHCQSKCTGR